MSGSAPPPTGQFQPMLTPGPWMDPSSGQPTAAFFELIRALWNRTGGSTTIIGPGGIGLAAILAAIAAAQADANSALLLGELGIMAGDDDGSDQSIAELTQTVEMLALAGDDSPPPGPDQGALLGFAMSDN